MITRIVFMLVLVTGSVNTLSAEIISKTGTFGGLRVNYKVILPKGYDASRSYPTVLAFAGGSQEMRIVDSVLQNHFLGEAERRGYIVVSPEAPNGRLFFEGGALAFPEFVEQILKDYKVESGRLHIAGRSNGGLSAFHIAASHPRYFRSLTGFPGYLLQATDARMDAIKNMCIYMHVGENDPAWLRAMRQQYETLRRKDFRIQFQVEAGQGHGLETLAGNGSKRLFDHFEEASKTCK